MEHWKHIGGGKEDSSSYCWTREKTEEEKSLNILHEKWEQEEDFLTLVKEYNKKRKEIYQVSPAPSCSESAKKEQEIKNEISKSLVEKAEKADSSEKEKLVWWAKAIKKII